MMEKIDNWIFPLVLVLVMVSESDNLSFGKTEESNFEDRNGQLIRGSFLKK